MCVLKMQTKSCWVLQYQEHSFLLFFTPFWFFHSCSLNVNKMGFPSFLCTIPGVLYLLYLLPRTWRFAGGFPKLNLSWWVFQLWIWKRIWLQESPDHWNERIGQYVITVSGELLKKKKILFKMPWEHWNWNWNPDEYSQRFPRLP